MINSRVIDISGIGLRHHNAWPIGSFIAAYYQFSGKSYKLVSISTYVAGDHLGGTLHFYI